MVRRKNKKSPKEQTATVEFPPISPRFTVAVVGGGASGIAAACTIGRAAQISHEAVRVVLIERSRRIGSSILRSGNGRCNFSNQDMRPDLFNRPLFVKHVFEALEIAFDEIGLDGSYAFLSESASENAVLRWFKSLGLVWTESSQNEGALYPFSNKASSVLEVLTSELDRCDVEQYCGVEVLRIEEQEEGFSLLLDDAFADRSQDQGQNQNQDQAQEKEPYEFIADVVVYAAGGALRSSAAEKIIGPKGILRELEWVPPVPVLGPLETETRLLKGLDGIRVKARLSCPERSFYENGEVLFRPYGISGIVVFNASRFVEPGDLISLDLAPEWSFAELEDMLFERSRLQSSRKDSAQTYGDLLQGFFLPEVAEALLKACDLDLLGAAHALHSPTTLGGITQLAARVKSFTLRVTDHGSPDQSQVCRGGVYVESIDPLTMQALPIDGLYVTGEALDVDGPCGGYNLHWAWATGLLAGLSVVKERSVDRMLFSGGVMRSGV